MITIFAIAAVALSAWLLSWIFHRRHTGAAFTWRTWFAVVAAIFATGVTALLILNLSSPEKKIGHEIHAKYSVEDPQFDRVMGNLLGPTVVDGNRIQTLVNGDEIFPSMLDAIRKAQKTITFEMYIYWRGETGKQFADALSERARAGVKCHVILDYFGSYPMNPDLIKEMETAGVEVEKYHAPSWYTLDRLNNRTHRKIVVVDGRIGFIGGVGIGDEWSGHAQDKDHWRDTHYRVEGPVVGAMQTAFMDNWLKTHENVLHDERYFPKIEEITSATANGPAAMATAPVTTATATATGARAQASKDSYEDGSENARLMFLLAIACARKSIVIENSYFVPDKMAVKALTDAAARGVKVDIVGPGPITDAKPVREASHAEYGPLLQAGIKIYEYQPTFIHCKVMVVDGFLSSVGSCNFDDRSFHLNDEANLNVFDHEFARQQTAIIEDDEKKCRPYTLDDWKKRTWTEKTKETVTSRFKSQL